MKLRLGGKPFEAALPVNFNVTRFLDSAPDGELFLAGHIAEKLGIAVSSLSSAAGRIPRQYRQSVGKICYWGNPKTIAELKRQVG